MIGNTGLANEAIFAINDSDFTDVPGMCKKFVRQVNEAYYGDRFAACLEGSSAVVACRNFEQGCSPDVQVYEAVGERFNLLPGDTLFKKTGSGPYGHTGIYVGAVAGIGSDLVAENSSTHIGRINGAKGYRSREQWGHIDTMVRFPILAPAPRLVIATPHESGWIYQAIPSAEYDADAQHFTVNAADVAGRVFHLAATSARVPVRDCIDQLGYEVATISDRMADADPRMYLFAVPHH